MATDLENQKQADLASEEDCLDNKYYGKYRGVVLDNNDPEGLGRLKLEVENIEIDELPNWAMPCTPYAGPGEGFFFLPPLKANVWVEFAMGDVNYPIWSGCYWNDKEDVPVLESAGEPKPEVKVLQTGNFTLTLDDTTEETAGSLILTCKAAGVKTEMKLTVDQNGVKLENSPAVITIKPEESIVVEYPNGKISMLEESMTIELSSTKITLKDKELTVDTTTTNINADTNIDGNLTVSKDTTIDGNSTIKGNAEVQGNETVKGNSTISGNADISGNLSVSGTGSISSSLAVG